MYAYPSPSHRIHTKTAHTHTNKRVRAQRSGSCDRDRGRDNKTFGAHTHTHTNITRYTCMESIHTHAQARRNGKRSEYKMCGGVCRAFALSAENCASFRYGHIYLCTCVICTRNCRTRMFWSRSRTLCVRLLNLKQMCTFTANRMHVFVCTCSLLAWVCACVCVLSSFMRCKSPRACQTVYWMNACAGDGTQWK